MPKRGANISRLIAVLIVPALVSCPRPDGSDSDGASPVPFVGCVDFEDLTVGTTYAVGDTFATSGVGVELQAFTHGGGGTTIGGFAEVEAGGLAGGTGQELEVNNILLVIDFGGPADGLSLRFGEYGGNLNIDINGDFRNFDDFVDLDGMTIGGVDVAVVNGAGNDTGTLTLTGVVNMLSLGGQELWIDDVCRAPKGEGQ